MHVGYYGKVIREAVNAVTSHSSTENWEVARILVGKSTLDAMAKLQSALRNANGRTSAFNRYVVMLTLDVKNAFNCSSWTAIKRRWKEPSAQYICRTFSVSTCRTGA
ncbi:Reverse transcriptase domain-containing protein [Aphis craccivora]|uniref:Reverse transcriptase domain-containing protein n=1 Tax=Aphis craccivora TaxID=307492 RepID=A0A6G0VUC0_APHCR|nr:Reverse transcriptase domain-containing protein [Aphis craccivora]